MDDADRRRMLGLFTSFFEGVTDACFASDLADKNIVLLLEDRGRLCGFTTLRYYRATAADEEELDIVYSGDTIVDPAVWNGSLLAPAWIAAVERLHRESGSHRRLLWLLITSGFRTYRFLPLFWREFHPRHDSPTPSTVRRTLDGLADERWGRWYDPSTGVVRFPSPQVLRPRMRGIPPSRLRNPHVDFFARVNRGHERGDELVCLTEIAESNLTSAGRRMVGRGRSLVL